MSNIQIIPNDPDRAKRCATSATTLDDGWNLQSSGEVVDLPTEAVNC